MLMSCAANAQTVDNPIVWLAAKDRSKSGQTYVELTYDISHNGKNVVLLDKKLSVKENEELEWLNHFSSHPDHPVPFVFSAFIRTAEGTYSFAGYLRIDPESYYFGYIDEVKQYGIVSDEFGTDDNGTHLGFDYQVVYCYTFDGVKIKKQH